MLGSYDDLLAQGFNAEEILQNYNQSLQRAKPDKEETPLPDS